MTTARIVNEGEVSLNGILFPIIGRVQPTLTSVYPEKIVIGDVTQDSQPHASVISWHDWRAGIGVERMTERDAADRAWWSTCQTRFDCHLLLPPLATTTAASGVTGVWTVGAMGELANEIYVAFGTAVRKYNNVTDSWGSTLTTLPAVATDAISFRLGGVDYLAFAHTDGYTYTSDGAAWTNDATDTKFMAFWDTRLWGIDNTGQLWRSTAIGVETNDAVLPIPTGYVNGLLSARNAAGNIVLYATTRVGPYQHAATPATFEIAEPAMPSHPDNGIGVTRWRDSVFISAGLAVFAVINGTNSQVVTLIGPDLDHGLPTGQQGSIIKLTGSTNDLLALIDGTTPAAEVDMFDGSAMGSHITTVINVDTGFSEILGWNGKGWETKWLGAASTAAAEYMLVSSAYTTYRLWWAHNQRVYWMTLPVGILNPDQATSFAFAASGEHITPWVTVAAKDVDALALQLHVEVQRATEDETVVVDYGLDYATTYTSLGTITTNGITTYSFPNSTTPSGTAFRSIRFRVTLARGTVNTNSPDVVSMTFVYRKKLKPRWGATFIIDLSGEGLFGGEYKGLTARQLQNELVTAAESNALVAFTFHDDTTSGNPRNYYVDIHLPGGSEESGRTFGGHVTVTVVEP